MPRPTRGTRKPVNKYLQPIAIMASDLVHSLADTLAELQEEQVIPEDFQPHLDAAATAAPRFLLPAPFEPLPPQPLDDSW